MTRPPHELASEQAVIGDMLNLPDRVGDIAAALVVEDFYSPTNGAAFAALVDARRRGDALDAASLVAVMRHGGLDPGYDWAADVAGAGSGAWAKHAEVIVDRRLRRDTLKAATEATAALHDLSTEARDVAGVLTARVEAALAPRTDAGLSWDADEFAAELAHQAPPWRVPGLFRAGWRVVIIGPEGWGKSVIARQVAYCAAKGRHPFGMEPIPPVTTLLLDAENPADALSQTFLDMRRALSSGWFAGGSRLIHRPGGLNLRSRSEVIRLETELRRVRPQLVAMGPAYKLYNRRGNETDEDAVRDLQAVLDDLRTRHDFALLIEHHQPNEAPGTKRPARPHGSALWRRWPEVGIRLEPGEHGSVKLERFRGDRLVTNWPDRLDRGVTFPWVGVWANADRRTPA